MAPRSGRRILTGILGAGLAVQCGVSPSVCAGSWPGVDSGSALAVDVLVDDRQWCAAAGDGEVGRLPEVFAHAGAGTGAGVFAAHGVSRTACERCTTVQIASVGGSATSRCTWSAWPLKSTNSRPTRRSRCAWCVRKRVSISPVKTGWPVGGHQHQVGCAAATHYVGGGRSGLSQVGLRVGACRCVTGTASNRHRPNNRCWRGCWVRPGGVQRRTARPR
jgi:hypothetical protein